jgi:hypothetical protein
MSIKVHKYHVVAMWEMEGGFDVEAVDVEEAKDKADQMDLSEGESNYAGGWEVVWVGEYQEDGKLKVIEENYQ